MYVRTEGLGAYRGRGMGELEYGAAGPPVYGLAYDAEGFPIEDPANTTYGTQSGGMCPGSPGCPGYVAPASVPIGAQLVTLANQYSTALVLGGAGLLALVLFRGRR